MNKYPYKIEVSDGRIILAVDFEESTSLMNLMADRELASRVYGGVFLPNGESDDIFPPVLIMIQEPECGNFDEFTGLRKVK